MEREAFVTRRRRIAEAVAEALEADLPEGAIAVHHPDSIGTVGVDFGDQGYILVQVEDAPLTLRGDWRAA